MTTHQILSADTSFGKLAYIIDGALHQGALPVVLMQRFRGTMDDWDPSFIQALAATRPVIRFDSAGIGRSEGTTPDSIEGMADVAIAFLKAVKLSKVDLLGWSLGGMVAQHVALKDQALVNRLIIAGSGSSFDADGTQPDPRIRSVATKPEIVDEDFLFLFFTDDEIGVNAGRAHLARLEAAGNRGPLVRMESIMQQGRALQTWQGARSRLGELKLPILVANGVADIMEPAYRSYVISQEAPNAKAVLYPNSGHGFLFQHIDEFVGEVDRFLQ